eukprot:Pgem_evm2s2062
MTKVALNPPPNQLAKMARLRRIYNGTYGFHSFSASSPTMVKKAEELLQKRFGLLTKKPPIIPELLKPTTVLQKMEKNQEVLDYRKDKQEAYKKRLINNPVIESEETLDQRKKKNLPILEKEDPKILKILQDLPNQTYAPNKYYKQQTAHKYSNLIYQILTKNIKNHKYYNRLKTESKKDYTLTISEYVDIFSNKDIQKDFQDYINKAKGSKSHVIPFTTTMQSYGRNYTLTHKQNKILIFFEKVSKTVWDTGGSGKSVADDLFKIKTKISRRDLQLDFKVPFSQSKWHLIQIQQLENKN